MNMFEHQRSLLRRKLVESGDNPAIRTELLRIVQPEYIQKAAQRGIFIAYIKDDEDFASELYAVLRESGLPVWMDVADIGQDDDGPREEQRALQRSGVMLLVASQATIEDERVGKMVSYYFDAGKIVVPVIYQMLEYEFNEFLVQPVDFRSDYFVGMNRLMQLLGAQDRNDRKDKKDKK